MNRNDNLIFALLATLTLLFLVSVGIGQTTKSPLPAPTGYVNDFAGVIDRSNKERLETILGNLDKQQKIQFSVVTVKTTGGQDIFDYSLAVARGWGIGSKDTDNPSLLLLIAIDDHKYFTQVSRHLEGDLPDGLVGQIQRDKLVPAFRQQQYGQGIFDTIQTYMATLAQKRGFTIAGIDQTSASQPTRRPTNSRPARGISTCGVVFIILIILVFLIVASRGGGGGCLNLFLLGSLFSGGGRSDSSGWGGGGSGGGFGGFGGGGDFGGGGAGGSW